MDNLFDLNIENVLEHWGVEHAIREIIANALDEKTLTNTQNININFLNGVCSIRDYGRGLQYIHFTQNENVEKLNATNLIGKFGVGLKDALGVFHRHNVEVIIHSKYSTITLTTATKKGFDIQTLHAVFSSPQYPTMIGTNVILKGIKESEICKAMDMFLVFNKDLSFAEKTKYGEVYLNKKGSPSKIYANGVQIAIEENFMFSYNITNMNAQMKKALNRERSNVGRTAYSDTIKNILKNCVSKEVLKLLVSDIKNIILGNSKDETNWVDIASYASITLNKNSNVIFMTPLERSRLTNQQVEILKNSEKELIMVTDAIFDKISSNVTTFETISTEYNESFQYKFINFRELSQNEKETFLMINPILNLLYKKYKSTTPNVRISETIRMDTWGMYAEGVWDAQLHSIIIKRSVLSSKEKFCGVFIHEFAHYFSGYDDNTREFENILTDMIGYIFNELNSFNKS